MYLEQPGSVPADIWVDNPNVDGDTEFLFEAGLLTSTKAWGGKLLNAEPTERGRAALAYCEAKAKTERKARLRDELRFWIPIAISVCALLVAIFKP